MMNRNQVSKCHTGEILDEKELYSLGELCRICGITAERIIDMVAEGILEPSGTESVEWRFRGSAVVRTQVVLHLQRDLRVNLPGAALALELLEEIEALRKRNGNR